MPSPLLSLFSALYLRTMNSSTLSSSILLHEADMAKAALTAYVCISLLLYFCCLSLAGKCGGPGTTSSTVE